MRPLSKLNIPLLLVISWLISCSNVSVTDNGGGTDFPNTRTLSGIIYADSGKAASNTIVKLIPDSYNPQTTPDSAILIDTTDNEGKYTFHTSKKGSFNIEAVDSDSTLKAFVADVNVDSIPENDKSPLSIPDGHLKKPGTIVVPFPDFYDWSYGYVYMRGTNCKTFSDTSAKRFIISQVPCGYTPPVIYSSRKDTVSKILIAAPYVSSSDTIWIDRARWTRSIKLQINTTPDGSGCQSNLYDFPLVVKLTKSDIDFSSAKPSGEDVRFTNSNGRCLSYQIESWNSASQEAIIWVLVDTIRANNSSQYICMYWGNSTATDSSSGADVFRTENGFQAVWHLDENWADSIHVNDATANKLNGLQYGKPDTAVQGIIGKAHHFDGASFIDIPLSQYGPLDFSATQDFTISAWVYASVFDSTYRQIISKSSLQYGIQLLADNKWDMFYVSVSPDQSGWAQWNGVRTAATDNEWVHITGVKNGSGEYIYVNGQLADSTIVTTKTYAPNVKSNVRIGGEPNTYPCFWNGNIDEVQMSSTARSSDWIKLSFMNQKEYSKVITVRR